MRWLVAMACACGPGLQHHETRDAARDVIEGASGDAATIEKLLRGSVIDGGIYFVDPICLAAFPNASEIHPDRFGAFASCLAGLHFHASARVDPLGDVVVLTYPPGLEIEARIVADGAGARLTWIGYESRRDNADGLPTVAAETLDALRLAGDRNGPLDPGVASTLELDRIHGEHGAYTWLKICLDPTGAVTGVHPRDTTSPRAARAFAAAAEAWRFQPFTIAGQPLPVCAMVRMVFPTDQPSRKEVLPYPVPSATTSDGPYMITDGAMTRISGVRAITPDDDAKTAIDRARVSRLTGSFRVCVDDTGHVTSVVPIRSTGIASYDRKLEAGMRRWVYAPILDEGKPIAVCTGVTFIYSQR